MKHINTISLVLLGHMFCGCASWPEEGRGGWAESFSPDGVEQEDAWYWQNQKHLETEFDHLSMKLQLLQSRGIQKCMPGQLHQANLMLNRVNRELSAQMLADAQADLLILYHQLNQLERHFNIIIEKTQCVVDIEAPSKETNKDLLTRIETLLNSDNQFAFNNFQVTQKYMMRIAQVSELIKLAGDIKILLVGHADAQGSDNANYELAFKRAEQVKHWLAVYGANKSNLVTLTQGEKQPLTSFVNEGNVTDLTAKNHSDRRVNAYILPSSKTNEVKQKQELLPLSKWTHELNSDDAKNN